MLGNRIGITVQVPEYLTPKEAAAILRVSHDTVTKHFENRKGVLIIGTTEGLRKRRYRTLRIPREALESFIVENRVN